MWRRGSRSVGHYPRRALVAPAAAARAVLIFCHCKLCRNSVPRHHLFVLADQVTRFWRFRHALQIFCQLRGSMQMKSVVGHSLVHFLAARTPRGSLGGPVGARKRDRAAHVASGAEFIRALSGCPPGTWGWSGLIFCKTLIQDRRNRQNPIRITTRRRRKSKKTYKTRTDKCHVFGFPATGPNTPPTTTLLAEKKGGVRQRQKPARFGPEQES